MTTHFWPAGFIQMPGEEFSLPGVGTPPGSQFSYYPVWTIETPSSGGHLYWLSIRDNQMWVSRLSSEHNEWDAPEEWAFWIDKDGAVVSEVFSCFVDNNVIDVLVAHWDEIEARINELEAIGKVKA